MTTLWTPRSAAHENESATSSLIAAVAETLLRESSVDSPTDQDRTEARRLALTVVSDAALTLEAVTGVSEWTRHRLVDLATLVAADPETASVEQVQEVALALRALLSPAGSGMER